MRTIRDWLNESGMRTYRGRKFVISSLHSIIENRAYLGECVYNRRTESKWHRYAEGQSVERNDEGLEMRPESDVIVCEDAWPPIIDREAFDLVQERRNAHKAKRRHVVGASVCLWGAE